MKKIHLFLWLVFAISMSSCTTTFQVIDVAPKSIQKVAIPKTVTKIFTIEKGHDMIYNQKLSDSMQRVAFKAINTFTPQSKDRVIYAPEDTIEQQEYATAVGAILQHINKEKDIRYIVLPDSIMKVLNRCGENFVLCSATEGFVRTEENYNKEYAKAFGRALVAGLVGGLIAGTIAGSMGRAATFNVGYYGGDITKHGAGTFLFMVDLKNKNLIYYDYLAEPSSPTVPQYVSNNIGRMLNNYYILKKAKPRYVTYNAD